MVIYTINIRRKLYRLEFMYVFSLNPIPTFLSNNFLESFINSTFKLVHKGYFPPMFYQHACILFRFNCYIGCTYDYIQTIRKVLSPVSVVREGIFFFCVMVAYGSAHQQQKVEKRGELPESQHLLRRRKRST